MNVYRKIEEVPFDYKTIITVGTFDGIHLGHQHILNELKSYSSKYNLRQLLITIEPHPQIVLNRKPDLKLLSTIEERLILLEGFGIENVFVIPFDKIIAEFSPKFFIKDYLFEKIGFSHILIGFDHLFGKNREGNKSLLDELGIELDFKVDMISELENNNHKISSTTIRHSLLEGNLDIANSLLGHDYQIFGKVVVGDKRGRTIGIPTANIESTNQNKLIPYNGVYFVSSEINNIKYFGMCNIGNRPTFTDGLKRTIEINFFDFDKDIYGEFINVSFHQYIRNEMKFNSVDEFLKQINQDKENCYNLIKNYI